MCSCQTTMHTQGSEISNSLLGLEQKKDLNLELIVDYLEREELPKDARKAEKLMSQSRDFVLLNGVLHFVEKGGGRRRIAVPSQMRQSILQKYHGGVYSGHFASSKLFGAISRCWWPGMYKDVVEFCRSCPDCAVVSGGGRKQIPPLQPIPVQRPFQIFGVDVMELPTTMSGNRYVIVFQDFLTKWPLVFPAPYQKAIRIARLLAEEILPMFGVPEFLLSDRGTNLLANVMKDVCELLGIEKLNTTAYHPQCNGMVERFNRTLKAMLRKHAVKFGPQWDQYLPGVLWAYRNTPHEATKEKPSFLMFGVDLRSPTEAALVPTETVTGCDVADYKEELILSLSSAWDLAVTNIKHGQQRNKERYDQKVFVKELKVGDWVLVRFPHEESGKQRKLSKPWHGPYRIIQKTKTGIIAVPIHFPESGSIQVHSSRVTPCPPEWPVGFYWYGGNEARLLLGLISYWKLVGKFILMFQLIRKKLLRRIAEKIKKLLRKKWRVICKREKKPQRSRLGMMPNQRMY